jgi:hypothetical protein
MTWEDKGDFVICSDAEEGKWSKIEEGVVIKDEVYPP